MEKSFWKELWLLLLVVFAGLLIVGIFFVVEIVFGVRSGMLDVTNLHILQWMQTIFIMLLPPMIWYKWRIKKDPICDFGFKSINWKFVILAAIYIVISLPGMELLTLWGEIIPWPSSLKESFDQAALDNYNVLCKLMSPSGILGWIEIVALVSIGTAIGEETMFRGGLLKCFSLTKLNKHWTACIIGLIFAIIHFEPAGFIVRWLMGSILCYFIYWSGSIWPSIVAHALNNLAAIIEFKCFNIGDPSDESANELTFGYGVSIASIVLAFAFLYYMYKNQSTKQND